MSYGNRRTCLFETLILMYRSRGGCSRIILKETCHDGASHRGRDGPSGTFCRNCPPRRLRDGDPVPQNKSRCAPAHHSDEGPHAIISGADEQGGHPSPTGHLLAAPAKLNRRALRPPAVATKEEAVRARRRAWRSAHLERRRVYRPVPAPPRSQASAAAWNIVCEIVPRRGELRSRR